MVLEFGEASALEFWSQPLDVVGVMGLVGLLGGKGSELLPSLVRFFLRNPRVGIQAGALGRRIGQAQTQRWTVNGEFGAGVLGSGCYCGCVGDAQQSIGRPIRKKEVRSEKVATGFG